MTRWTHADIPSLAGRSAIITGTGGLGYEVALVLARKGANVVIAGRDPAKGAVAVAKIRAACSTASVRFEALDLASLGSVSAFCRRLNHYGERLDLLINNAAVMTPPERRETADGFELQFGTNYLGHFALTAGLLPLLQNSDDARVVSLSSVAARSGSIDFGNLNAERGYRPGSAYGQSKLACLMFALELQRRSAAAGWNINSFAAHPGITRTDLLVNGAGANSAAGRVRRFLPFLFQPAWQGALPTLFAATSPLAKGGSYFGPDKLSETRGYPAPSKVPAQAMDEVVARRLWLVSEKMTRVSLAQAELAEAG